MDNEIKKSIERIIKEKYNMTYEEFEKLNIYKQR